MAVVPRADVFDGSDESCGVVGHGMGALGGWEWRVDWVAVWVG